ncbi:SH3 domain-containing protein [Mesorhizobium sp. NZP2077]|nr:SH3 domain-containing protein [Mesorhizobium sp. NZP2077]
MLPTPLSPLYRPLLPGEGEIASAPVSSLTSPGLADLKKLINEADALRKRLEQELADAEKKRKRAEIRLNRSLWLIARLFNWRRIPHLQAKVLEERNNVDKLEASLNDVIVNLEFDFDQNMIEKYQRDFESDFRKATQSAKIWDVTASYFADKFKQRTVANHMVERKTINFGFGNSEIVNSPVSPMRLGNANGEDILIYPAFVLMRDQTGDFALIDLMETSLTFSGVAFHEEEVVPADANVIGKTWKYANKDGSPDRRFNNNFPIPIVRCGELRLTGKQGLNEAFQLSNASSANALASSFANWQKILSSGPITSGPKATPTGSAEESFSDERNPREWGEIRHRGRSIYLAFDLIFIFFSILLIVHLFSGTSTSGMPTDFPKGVERQEIKPTINESPPARPEPIAPSNIRKIQPPELDVHAQNPPKDSTGEEPQPSHKPTEHPARVKVDFANVRSSPSTKSEVILRLPKGAILNVIGKTNDWYQVKLDTGTGWMNSVTLDVDK